MTVHPRETKVALAAKPVALGVALVPVIVTVLLLYAVVKPVPSNAASLTNKPSTEVWSRAQLVIITLPLTRCNVLPSVNVLNAAVAETIFMLTDEEEPITSMAGKVKDVNAPIVFGEMFPLVRPVRSKEVPMLFKAGNEIVVNAAIAAGLKLLPINSRTGKEKVVNDAIVLGLRLAPIKVSEGKENVGKGPLTDGDKLLPI